MRLKRQEFATTEMADTINNKTKLQLGSGFVRSGPGSPSTPTKLLINHGKPNFTIQRSPKMDEQRKFATTAQSEHNNSVPISNGVNNNVVSTTKFFGVLNTTTKEKSPEIVSVASEENEGTRVQLRRTPTIAPVKRSEDDGNVPEFILRQRAIQERLAKENVLDFDKRRSGYFTHVLISPTSTNRTSFAETMSSPAVNPAMEIPNPTVEIVTTSVQENDIIPAKQVEEHVENEVTEVVSENSNELVKIHEDKEGEDKEQQIAKDEAHVAQETSEVIEVNGHGDDEEVANAIEEVNKALAGEESNNVVVEETESHEDASHEQVQEHIEDKPKENGHEIDENNNDNSNEVEVHESITISHTNGIEVPHVASADPSGALGVNYEPKTVVSFSRDLGAGENKYPDTVSVAVKEKTPEEVAQDNALKELTKLKFDITTTNGNDINVVPVIVTESAVTSS